MNSQVKKLTFTALMAAMITIFYSIYMPHSGWTDKLEYLIGFLGGEFHVEGAYQAWEYKEDSALRDLMVAEYEAMYGQKPAVEAIHAGLECGLFYEKLSGLDCVSFGPNMKAIHTTEERLSISSVERTYQYLCRVLEQLSKRQA